MVILDLFSSSSSSSSETNGEETEDRGEYCGIFEDLSSESSDDLTYLDNQWYLESSNDHDDFHNSDSDMLDCFNSVKFYGCGYSYNEIHTINYYKDDKRPAMTCRIHPVGYDDSDYDSGSNSIDEDSYGDDDYKDLEARIMDAYY